MVEREREIEKFVPQEYWLIEALLRQQIPNSKFQISNKSKIQNPKLKTDFKASLVKKDGKTIPKFGINTKKQAEKIIKDLEKAEYKIVKKKKQKKGKILYHRLRPALFSKQLELNFTGQQTLQWE